MVVPPFSEMELEARERDTVGAASSSVIVRVTSEGLDTPLVPLTEADTSTDLSAASAVLSLAVIVTAPELEVPPAAMVRVLFELKEKSPETAGETAAADTVSVTVSLDSPLREAVTVALPPFSEIEESESESVTVGVASSSVSVRAAPVTAPAPWELAAVAVTVVVRAVTLSTLSSTAFIVAVSEELEVCPAEITMVLSAPRV